MAFHTVLVPPVDQGLSAADRMAKTMFLKDGFVIGAFVFTGLWLLAKRLWLAAFLFGLAWLAIGFGGQALGIHPMGLLVAQALIGWFLGLEGHALLERKLTRQGWTVAGVVEGKDIDQVERRFFETQAEDAAAPGPIEAPRRDLRSLAQPGVLGLFPDAAGARPR
jgi:hypothetical protein